MVDAAVVALLRTGTPAEARRALEILLPATDRAPDDLHVLLLEAHIERARRRAARARLSSPAGGA